MRLLGAPCVPKFQSQQYNNCGPSQEGVRLLDRELRAEVEAQQEALLRQAGRLGEAEPALQGVALAVGSLQGSVRRVRAEIMEPYEQVGVKGVWLKT